MDFDNYQQAALRTDTNTGSREWNNPLAIEKLLGLGGEAGEVMDKFKKILRDKGGEVSTEDREEIVKELGDCLWYIAVIAEYLDEKLSDVAEKNIKKLADRAERNKISGAGDNR